jgi:hypothetical protein
MRAERKLAMFHATEDIHIQWTKVVLHRAFFEEELRTEFRIELAPHCSAAFAEK